MNRVDNDLQSDLLREVAPKNRPRRTLPKIMIIVILILAGIVSFYLLYNNAPTKIVNIPKATPPTTKIIVAPASDSPVKKSPPAAKPSKTKSITKITRAPGDSARAIIAKFRAQKGATDLQQLLTSANEFNSKGMYTDAYLLYFFAAKQGSRTAAQVLAKIHDPTYHSKQTSIMDQPDLVQAYKWYQQAARGGQATAQKALDTFRAQVEQMAASGHAEAKQLSLQWQ